MNLLLFLLLGMLLTIVWFVMLDLWNLGWGDHILGKSHRKKRATEIESGRMPASLRQHIINVLYSHRFGWFLIIPISLVMLFSLWVAPWVLRVIDVDPASNGGGTITVAVISLPILSFIWFIRAYERVREISRAEVDHWSSEFSALVAAASDYKEESKVLRRTAIRQLQDYLNGAKWGTNQRSNTTAIFELFSSIVSDEFQKLDIKNIEKIKGSKELHYHSDVLKARTENQTLLTVSAVLKATYKNLENCPCRVQVSQNSLDYMHFDILNITNTDFSGLSLRQSTFRYAVMWLANLTKADLFDANLHGVNLGSSKLIDASLWYADLSYAILDHIDFTGADLSNANFTGANLTGATLSGVRATEINLSGALLTGTGLKKEFVIKNFENAVFDEHTKWDV